MTEIIKSLPKRTPSREIDGDAAYEKYIAKQERGEDEAFVFAPAPDESIFKEWDDSDAGKLNAAATKPDDKSGMSKADKIRSVMDLLASDEDTDEFSSFNDMTLDDFKEMVADYDAKKSKRRTRKRT